MTKKEELENLRDIAQEKKSECDIKSQAYSITLTRLMPANLLLVVGAALLSLGAGSSLIIDQGIISKTSAGIMALVSSGFTVIHKTLKCDQYQSECKRLKNLYEGLSADYSNLEIEQELNTYKSKLEELNNEFSTVIKGATVDPIQGAINKAEAFRP